MRPALPLLTPRLCLRPLEAADLAAFTAYRADPVVARYQGWSDFTRADAEALLAGQAGLTFGQNEAWFQVAAAHRMDGMLLGDVAVHVIDQGRQAELGMTFARAAQGSGYAQEAVRAIVELLFTDMGLHRVIATIDARNDPARRLLERLGFRREGAYRQNVFFKGAWSDEYGYALLRSEWQQTTGVSTAPQAPDR